MDGRFVVFESEHTDKQAQSGPRVPGDLKLPVLSCCVVWIMCTVSLVLPCFLLGAFKPVLRSFETIKHIYKGLYGLYKAVEKPPPNVFVPF